MQEIVKVRKKSSNPIIAQNSTGSRAIGVIKGKFIPTSDDLGAGYLKVLVPGTHVYIDIKLRGNVSNLFRKRYLDLEEEHYFTVYPRMTPGKNVIQCVAISVKTEDRHEGLSDCKLLFSLCGKVTDKKIVGGDSFIEVEFIQKPKSRKGKSSKFKLLVKSDHSKASVGEIVEIKASIGIGYTLKIHLPGGQADSKKVVLGATLIEQDVRVMKKKPSLSKKPRKVKYEIK